MTWKRHCFADEPSSLGLGLSVGALPLEISILKDMLNSLSLPRLEWVCDDNAFLDLFGIDLGGIRFLRRW